MRGDAVEERQLEHAESQRGQHGTLQSLDGPAGQLGDHVVERRAPLHGAVRESRRERSVARIEPEPLRLAVQCAVGPRVLLEHAAQYGKRTLSCRGNRSVRARLGHGVPTG